MRILLLTITFLSILLLPICAFSDLIGFDQEKMKGETWDLFGQSTNFDKKQKGSEDAKILEQTLQHLHLYRHSAFTRIEAVGKSKEIWNLVEKDVELLYITEQPWDSFILYNRNGKIIEYRLFFPSKIFSAASKAGFKIKYIDKIGDSLKKLSGKIGGGRSGFKGAVSTALNKLGMLTKNEWEGEEAKQKLQDRAGNKGMLEPTIFSNLQYLIFYNLGDKYPANVIRIVPEGEGFAKWESFTEEEEIEEEIRKGTILRTAYLIDKAILPDGKPAKKGARWRVKANVFGDVMGLKTGRRLQKTLGSLSVIREESDAIYKGQKNAVISLVGPNMDNRIILETKPKRSESKTMETYLVHFIPNDGLVFWDFESRHISMIELNGVAEIERFHKKDWWPDTKLTVTPKFKSKYEAIIKEDNILLNPENLIAFKRIIPIVREKDDKIANSMIEMLGTH